MARRTGEMRLIRKRVPTRDSSDYHLEGGQGRASPRVLRRVQAAALHNSCLSLVAVLHESCRRRHLQPTILGHIAALSNCDHRIDGDAAGAYAKRQTSQDFHATSSQPL